MQLSKIKISGFKSFVDPTSIALPSNLIAVVGPNGCGKSNIIDAVTWVMGESSPKYLRGESLTDVIFNGSSARKPVGQASVELIFDNTDGSIGGEYAKYAEISVKRMINRDSDSTYYLNGVRCRKRDAVDLFLGTGLGPRSYSIIGQNMIGRIIEAKPEELRVYLEEAAGISKYKERRRETELRIQHTKENLARINDLRGELEKQLSHLKHQANMAEKFKSLKQQERQLRAELYGVQWRQLDGHMVDYTLQIQREETALEARNSELSGIDRDMEGGRQEQRAAQEVFQEVQRRYYAAGNDITRIEQEILHQEEKHQQCTNDLTQTDHDWQSVKDQMSETEDLLRQMEQDIQQIDPQLISADQEVALLQKELVIAEEAVQIWQNRWDEFNQLSSKTAQTVQVEKNHIQHVEQRISYLQKRADQLKQDQGRADFSELTKEIEEFSQKSQELTQQLTLQQNELTDIRREMSTLQTTLQDANTQLDKVRSESQRLRGEQASLEALQQTALGQRDNPTASWAAKHQLDKKPRLGQHIQVEKGWEAAVEIVLGFNLQAICVDNFAEVAPHLAEFTSGNLCIFTAQTSLPTEKSNETLLLEKITSPWPLESLLAGVYIAESVDEAFKQAESLADHESIITRDGIWLNRRWLKILREEDPAAGIFQREQELKQLSISIDHLESQQKSLKENITDYQEKRQALEQQRDQLQQAYHRQQAQSVQMTEQQKMKQERLRELQMQTERFIKELEECSTQLTSAQTELKKANVLWQQATAELNEHNKTREEKVAERDKARQQLHTTRENVNKKTGHKHELEIRLQTAKSQQASLNQNLHRLAGQVTTLNERKAALQNDLSAMVSIEALKESLASALNKHVQIENELTTARSATESLDQGLRQLEEKRQIIEREINKNRSLLESLRVEMQGWKVKSDTLVEQIKETELTLETILQNLPQEITVEAWQNKVDQIAQRIHRLGAINLVAIDEYATCLERKEYLDKQVEDLQSGLATLEDAIAKIDKETCTRFKETFDKVNSRFQELFPTIFGGGKAYLELNNDNYLEAGITMIACPPGKRNSSIYLLSGGEKSLTALALVFSIFHLNPAPFCLLDEVDAALDDVNVARFTRLVKVMADKTQFIFISHNKITIEMGQHLIGVTMNEPGVSRLVSVDIERAMSLVEA
jgi:chromosome segregation protein